MGDARTLLLCAATAFALALASGTHAAPSSTADPPGTSAAELGLTDLSDDLSRQALFADVRSAAAADDPNAASEGVQYFNLYGPFRFPNDVDFDAALHKPRVNSLFGVDVSHYTPSSFPIEQLHLRQVAFVYMKATQGTGSLDAKFAGFWSRAGALPAGSEVHRGAYHFLTSTDPKVDKAHWNEAEAADWGKAQAATFIKVIKANHGLRPTDMPPVVDLEWDKASANGPDRWAGRSSAQITAMIRAYLAEVSTQLNRTPMIYTAGAWWRERMPGAPYATFAAYPLWIADYSKSSRASEAPKSVGPAPWVLWQYTDSATMAIGFNAGFDANIYKGKTNDFYAALNVAQFQ